MTEILFVKTSSLGDVIHHMPAVTEAHARIPDARITWLVEEAYAPLVAQHPAVNEVIPVAWRRWRRSPFLPSTWREIAAARRLIKARHYDAVVDTQGLLRSALTASFASGLIHGYDRASVRESLATLFYDVKHNVPRDRHAIERNRTLTALALHYRPDGPPDYGLERRQFGAPTVRYGIFLHGTARPEKQWEPSHWVALGRTLAPTGVALVLPWGNKAEQERAAWIARAIPKGEVAPQMPIGTMAKLIAGAEFVIGVDTGLVHLAAAYGVPLVSIFTGSSPELTRPIGSGPIEVVGDMGVAPTVEEVAAAFERVTA